MNLEWEGMFGQNQKSEHSNLPCCFIYNICLQPFEPVCSDFLALVVLLNCFHPNLDGCTTPAVSKWANSCPGMAGTYCSARKATIIIAYLPPILIHPAASVRKSWFRACWSSRMWYWLSRLNMVSSNHAARG